MLAQSTGPEKSLRTQTTEDGIFQFLGLAPGDYSMRVEADGFIGARDRYIQLKLDENRRLFGPIVLGVEGHGGCWYDPVAPRYQVQGSMNGDVEVSGRIIPASKNHSTIFASVMSAESDVIRSTITDKQGRFKVLLPMAGVIELRILTPGRTELRTMLVPTDAGDRVLVSPIRVPNSVRKPSLMICE
jgi:hypothetical protein